MAYGYNAHFTHLCKDTELQGRSVLAEPTADHVRVFLRSHTDFLERFVMEEVELEILERWVIRSTQRAKKRPDATSTGKV
jgi:hypothetical protein